MSTAHSTVDLSGAVWRRSSRSGVNGNNGNCVEIAVADACWHTSSYSDGNGNNGNCVQVAFTGPAVAVRDSKNPTGSVLAFPAHTWTHFLPTP